MLSHAALVYDRIIAISRTSASRKKIIFGLYDFDEKVRAIDTGNSSAIDAAYDVWSVKKGMHEPCAANLLNNPLSHCFVSAMAITTSKPMA
jgi:hypothetical protein